MNPARVPVRGPLLAAACIAAALACVLAGRARAEAPAVTLTLLPDTLVADVNGELPATLRIRNDGDFGVYGDSVSVRIEPLGVADAKPWRNLVARAGSDVSGRDSLDATFFLPALAERSRVTFTYFGHDRSREPVERSLTCLAIGSVFDRMFPSRTIGAGAAIAEMIAVPVPDGTAAGNGAGLLILADAATPPRSLVLHAYRLAQLGIGVLIVGTPREGDDAAGPKSRALALAALDSLAHLPGVHADALGVWGIGWSGTTALRVADSRALRAVVAQSAHLERAAPGTKRSGAAVLVLHGERDTEAPAAAAQTYVTRAQAAGRRVEPQFVPGAGHSISGAESYRWVVQFLSAQLLGAK